MITCEDKSFVQHYKEYKCSDGRVYSTLVYKDAKEKAEKYEKFLDFYAMFYTGKKPFKSVTGEDPESFITVHREFEFEYVMKYDIPYHVRLKNEDDFDNLCDILKIFEFRTYRGNKYISNYEPPRYPCELQFRIRRLVSSSVMVLEKLDDQEVE